MPISRWVDNKKIVVHLHNGILHSRKKEGRPPFCDSMDGTGEYYVKWNKSVSERQLPYGLTYKRNLMNKIMRKVEPETWKQGTDWQWPEGKREGDNGGKKKGLVKEHVWMTHEHEQWYGDRLWAGRELDGGRQKGKK